MANGKARKIRAASEATSEYNPNPIKKGFNLNAHRAAVIVGLISLAGVLVASVLASGGSVVVALISNWDKLRSSQATQAAPDVTGDLLAYNAQRRVLVENAFDQALGHLQQAGEEVTGEDAAAIADASNALKEKKTEVGTKYDMVVQAIKDKKPVQADIHKTELNSVIISAQKEYDELPLRLSLLDFKIRDGRLELDIKKLEKRDPEVVRQIKKLSTPIYLKEVDGRWMGFVRVRRNYLVPPITFPSGNKTEEGLERPQYETVASTTSVNEKQKKANKVGRLN